MADHKRITLVTGANQGVGKQVAKELAANGPGGTYTRWENTDIPW